MGYTHFFNTNRVDGFPASLSKRLWTKKFVPIVRAIFEQASIDGIAIVNGAGEPNTVPLISNDEIRFNGIPGCETMLLTRSGSNFAFCKTNRNPYDAVVVGVILAAKDVFGNAFHWSSNGDTPEDFREGRDLLNRAYDALNIGA